MTLAWSISLGVVDSDEWRDSKNHPGEGGWRFWIYALKLQSAGMDFSQIKAKLTGEAKHGRTPKERLWADQEHHGQSTKVLSPIHLNRSPFENQEHWGECPNFARMREP
jgi:hypothetical protein